MPVHHFRSSAAFPLPIYHRQTSLPGTSSGGRGLVNESVHGQRSQSTFLLSLHHQRTTHSLSAPSSSWTQNHQFIGAVRVSNVSLLTRLFIIVDTRKTPPSQWASVEPYHLSLLLLKTLRIISSHTENLKPLIQEFINVLPPYSPPPPLSMCTFHHPSYPPSALVLHSPIYCPLSVPQSLIKVKLPREALAKRSSICLCDQTVLLSSPLHLTIPSRNGVASDVTRELLSLSVSFSRLAGCLANRTEQRE